MTYPQSSRGPTIPEHVFISFSQEDQEFAEKVVEILQRKDIPTWIDYSKLVPGTSDWETSIRDAIDKSFAVVVLASPRSRASKFVRGELAVAEAKGCEIYPLWIDGAEWSDCIPLGMTYTQFVDARSERLETGIIELCRVLAELLASSTPKHYLVSPLRRIIGSKFSRNITTVSLPPGFICVDLANDEGASWEDGGSGVFMRSADYSCVHALLDDLYLSYLVQRFKPFNYGLTWILQEVQHFSSRLLVPWHWLLKRHPSSDMDSEWLHHTPLSTCGLAVGTSWCIRTPIDLNAVGLAINDERIFRAIRNSPKAEYFLRDQGVLENRSIEEVGSDYRYRYVISYRDYFGSGDSPPGTAIVQTPKTLPEELIRFWLHE